MLLHWMDWKELPSWKSLSEELAHTVRQCRFRTFRSQSRNTNNASDRMVCEYKSRHSLVENYNTLTEPGAVATGIKNSTKIEHVFQMWSPLIPSLPLRVLVIMSRTKLKFVLLLYSFDLSCMVLIRSVIGSAAKSPCFWANRCWHKV